MTTLLFSFLLLLLLLCSAASSAGASAPRSPVDIGIILDLDSPVGQICHLSIKMALADSYVARPNSTTNLRLHYRNCHSDVITAASAAIDLISNHRVTAILGPQSSLSASFLANVGTKCHVPVISYSATSPSVSPSQNPYFVRAAVIDSATAAPIAALVQAFGWRRVVPIYEDSDFGSSFLPSLFDALDAVGSQVPYRVSVPISATDDQIQAELYRLKTMQTRVFVVHVTSPLVSRIFTNAKTAGMMGKGFAWIVTDGVTSSIGSIDPSVVLDSMQGVLGVKPYIPKSDKLKAFKRRWKREFLKENPNSDITEVSTYGIWAYDAVFALAMAAEAARPINSGPNRNQPSPSNTELSNLPVLQTGQSFLNSILTTEFVGLAGKFRLVGGELNVSAFQIVNIVGEKGRSVGFWKPKNGLVRRLDGSSNSNENRLLGAVIWPGDSMEVPNGFVQPTGGETLRIAVPGPIVPGFQAFLNTQRDPVTNKTTASGFVIEVFEAAVMRLPYALQYEYVMSSGESYDALLGQVPELYDAVVGDVTITANRANIVDFTTPYTSTGLSMVVSLEDERNTYAWMFLKPLKANLWMVSGFFFLFTGLAVWVLEHRLNKEFRGPPSHQAGTVFYFIFSTLVFSHKEAIASNLARVVMIVWVFVVLILQSSYTANLTSMLTVLHPAATGFNDLMKSNENVGYLENSLVKLFLTNMGFHESRLKPYKSPQQYAEALTKGTENGGVGAIVDEIPYLNVFLNSYCADNYIMVKQQTFTTGGFGFAFRKGSSIVPDLSRAILNLTESNGMTEIERRCSGDQGPRPNDNNNPFSSKSLDFVNFWGLFLVTGVASTICLIISVASFLYKNRGFLNSAAAEESSTKRRVQSVVNLYDKKDSKSRTFMESSAVLHNSTVAGSRDSTGSPSICNMNPREPNEHF